MENEEPIKKEKPRPLINDFYWFEVAKDLIDKAPEHINDSADKFKDLILWLWGIYTPIIGLGSSALSLFSKTTYSNAAIGLLVLPSVVLLFAYWAATKARSSTNVKFEPRSPEDIERAYYEGLRIKNKFYKISQILTGVSCALIPIAIMTANVSKSDDLRFNALLSNKNIIISGRFPNQKNVSLFIENRNLGQRTLIDEILQVSINLDDNEINILESGEPLGVYAEYNSEETIYRIGNKLRK